MKNLMGGLKIDGLKRTLASAQQLGKIGVRHGSGLFLSQGCTVCDRPTRQIFCIDCQRQLPLQQSSATQSPRSATKRPTQTTGHSASQPPVQQWFQDDIHSLPVSALGYYGGPLKRAILAMKYRDRPEVAKPLGQALAQQWLAQPLPYLSKTPEKTPLYVVPIPLHAERQALRGYNQANLIAQAFVQVSGLTLLSDGLKRNTATQPQHQLSLSAREQNLNQAFVLGRDLNRVISHHQQHTHTSQHTQGTAVLLIDDIYTTGTTARSAAQTLQEAGVTTVGILTLARATL